MKFLLTISFFTHLLVSFEVITTGLITINAILFLMSVLLLLDYCRIFLLLCLLNSVFFRLVFLLICCMIASVIFVQKSILNLEKHWFLTMMLSNVARLADWILILRVAALICADSLLVYSYLFLLCCMIPSISCDDSHLFRFYLLLIISFIICFPHFVLKSILNLEKHWFLTIMRIVEMLSNVARLADWFQAHLIYYSTTLSSINPF